MLKLKKDEAQALVWGESENFTTVAFEITGTSRWAINKRVIFRENGGEQLYGCDYSVGATEYQDQEPFEYQDWVDAYEVEIVMAPKYQKKAS